MRSSEFRCPEHISALKAQELKANFRDLLGFMPVFWKVIEGGLVRVSTYGGYGGMDTIGRGAHARRTPVSLEP
jgi:hypothetical protein